MMNNNNHTFFQEWNHVNNTKYSFSSVQFSKMRKNEIDSHIVKAFLFNLKKIASLHLLLCIPEEFENFFCGL